MPQNNLGAIKPGFLNQFLPDELPLGTAEWKFLRETGQVRRPCAPSCRVPLNLSCPANIAEAPII
jgi:hypothetical protein